MRCNQHGLAVGPGGECVLCLRAARDRAGRHARWLEIGFLGVVVSACGALLVARSLRTPPVAQTRRVASLVATAEASLPVETHETEPVAAPPHATDLAENEADLRVAAPVLAAAPISSVLVPAPPAERAPSARVPSSRELLAALHATPVSMFSTSWCPHCERARRFFRANGVSVVDHDVDADARAAAELKRRSGGKAVPLIDVDGRELKGFDERATIEAVVASVERRLGVTGLKLSVASVPARGG
ncbi:MAG TPA: glutaredoxin domain-containing protein [Polyangiaceae bacterium]|nr:glutaredoxin domain-containing protein [Polyangiaceae bacterium]